MNVLTPHNPSLSQPTNGAGFAVNCKQLYPCHSLIVSSYIEFSKADNTRKAYRSDLAHFLAWGGSIPSTPEQFAAYLAAHAGIFKASTLKRRLVSVGIAHTSQGFANPCISVIVRVTLRGICRIHGSSQTQAAPAVREDILAMVRGLAGIKGTRDRALLLLGFAGAFRRSELVGLNVSDLEFMDRGLVIHLRKSKTDQEGIGRKIAIPYARGTVCPVHAIKDWIAASGIIDGAIFRPITRHGQIVDARLSGQAVTEVVKECASAAGLKSENYSGHSLRAGLITSAAMLGVSVWKIKAQSGHKTDEMVSRYVRDSDLFTNNAAGAVL